MMVIIIIIIIITITILLFPSPQIKLMTVIKALSKQCVLLHKGRLTH